MGFAFVFTFKLQSDQLQIIQGLNRNSGRFGDPFFEGCSGRGFFDALAPDADGDRELSTPLTRYYAEAGTPPGQWLGSGVVALGKGEEDIEIVDAAGSVKYYRDEAGRHYVPKRTLDELIVG